VDRILIKSHAKVEIDPSLSIVQTDKTNDALEVNIEHSGHAYCEVNMICTVDGYNISVVLMMRLYLYQRRNNNCCVS